MCRDALDGNHEDNPDNCIDRDDRGSWPTTHLPSPRVLFWQPDSFTLVVLYHCRNLVGGNILKCHYNITPGTGSEGDAVERHRRASWRLAPNPQGEFGKAAINNQQATIYINNRL